MILTVLFGSICWAMSDEADWWAYVEDSEHDRLPKFKLHWPEQAVICGVHGLLLAIPVTFIATIVKLVGISIVGRRRVSASDSGIAT